MSVSMSPRSANMMFGVIFVLLVSCFFINVTAETPAPDCNILFSVIRTVPGDVCALFLLVSLSLYFLPHS